MLICVACFFWVQGLVRDAGDRALLFDMDNAIQRLNQSSGSRNPVVIAVEVFEPEVGIQASRSFVLLAHLEVGGLRA